MTLIASAAVALAIAALVWAWQITQQERRRSDARVAALRAVIDPGAPDESAAMFAAPAVSTPSGHPLVKIASGFGAVVTVILIAAAIAELRRSDIASPLSAAGPERPALALLSMSHDRRAGSLAVTGTVRHLDAEAPRSVVAVVSAFDRAGRLVGRAQGPVRVRASGPQSAFRVEVPDVAEVARYRVSFRGDGGIIRHADLRPSPSGRTNKIAVR